MMILSANTKRRHRAYSTLPIRYQNCKAAYRYLAILHDIEVDGESNFGSSTFLIKPRNKNLLTVL